MNARNDLPSLFIGSATESIDVARAIQVNLEFDFESTIWAQSVFAPTQPAATHLEAALQGCDFAAFVLSADDELISRGARYAVPRDNVVFELGLAVATLGPDRSFMVTPSDVAVRLPSDLAGLTTLGYRVNRRDRNTIAALGTACHAMRLQARRLVAPSRSDSPRQAGTKGFFSLEDYLAAWNTEPLLSARQSIRTIVLDPYSEEFNAVRRALHLVFAFLDSLADAILSGQVNEAEARDHFQTAVLSFWPMAATLLAPPNGTEIWETHLPTLAGLYEKWKVSA